MMRRLFNIKLDIELDDNLTLEEKKHLINQLLNKIIKLDDLQITLEDYLRMTWFKGSTKYFLSSLGTYLCKKDPRTDKYILSQTQLRKMKSGDSRQILFSDLPRQEKEKLGIIDYEEDRYDD